jgi:mannose-6-phosphate isomerase-like protein (cupin superfamily)
MNTSKEVKSADLIKSEDYKVAYYEKTSSVNSNLNLLSYGNYIIKPGVISGEYFHKNEESLLFCIHGKVAVKIEKQEFILSHYDTLYIPLSTPYQLKNISEEEGFLILCKAKAAKKHVPFYSSWDVFSKDEKRIRHLNKKDVYLMFDVSEKADKLIAGYTIYQPFTRAFPPHNHNDQEEIYIFIKGKGAMEVYEKEENKTFVTSVNEMDAVTIPLLNYHPVFSQEQELHFIWCIAGERYWVGDKNKDFMTGKTDKITT